MERTKFHYHEKARYDYVLIFDFALADFGALDETTWDVAPGRRLWVVLLAVGYENGRGFFLFYGTLLIKFQYIQDYAVRFGQNNSVLSTKNH